MGIKIQIIALIVGAAFLMLVLRSIRRKSFSPSFSVLWMLVSVFLISIPALEPFYRWFSYSVIGINDARHVIYIVLIGFLLVYLFYLSSKITRMSDQVQNLISNNSILKEKIDGDRK